MCVCKPKPTTYNPHMYLDPPPGGVENVHLDQIVNRLVCGRSGPVETSKNRVNETPNNQIVSDATDPDPVAEVHTFYPLPSGGGSRYMCGL